MLVSNYKYQSVILRAMHTVSNASTESDMVCVDGDGGEGVEGVGGLLPFITSGVIKSLQEMC